MSSAKKDRRKADWLSYRPQRRPSDDPVWECSWCLLLAIGEHRSCVVTAGPAGLRTWLFGATVDNSSTQSAAWATCSTCEPFVIASDARGLARNVMKRWLREGRREALGVKRGDLTSYFQQVLDRVHPEPVLAHLDC